MSDRMQVRPAMIEVEQLSKNFGDLVAVDNLSFSAQSGVIFGLLGPNGAGKSTTISCISGLLDPTAGKVRVNGADVVREPKLAKRSIGVVPQELALYEELSARENIQFWAGIQGLRGAELRSRTSQVLEEVGLSDRAKEPVKNYSGGMKRRLNFACGIAHRPKVLLCDEPTVGVDPQSRVRLLELVRKQRDEGTAVIYTTHYMEEAEDLCDELAIVDCGNIVASGSLDELRNLMGERDLVHFVGEFMVEEVRRAIGEREGTELLFIDQASIQLAVQGAPSRLAELLALLATTGAAIHSTSVRQPSLESLFIKLTGKELRE